MAGIGDVQVPETIGGDGGGPIQRRRCSGRSVVRIGRAGDGGEDVRLAVHPAHQFAASLGDKQVAAGIERQGSRRVEVNFRRGHALQVRIHDVGFSGEGGNDPGGSHPADDGVVRIGYVQVPLRIHGEASAGADFRLDRRASVAAKADGPGAGVGRNDTGRRNAPDARLMGTTVPRPVAEVQIAVRVERQSLDRAEPGEQRLASVSGEAGMFRGAGVGRNNARGDVVFADDGVPGIGDEQIAGGTQGQCRGPVQLGECAAASIAAKPSRALTDYGDDGPIGIQPLHAVAIHIADVEVSGSSAGQTGRKIETGRPGGNGHGVVDDGPSAGDDGGDSIADAAHHEIAIGNENVAIGMNPHRLRLHQRSLARGPVVESGRAGDGFDEDSGGLRETTCTKRQQQSGDPGSHVCLLSI